MLRWLIVKVLNCFWYNPKPSTLITNRFVESNDNETFNTINDNPKDTSYQLSIKQEIRKDIIKGIREDIKDGIRGDIKGDDIAKALGHMDKDNNYIVDSTNRMDSNDGTSTNRMDSTNQNGTS